MIRFAYPQMLWLMAVAVPLLAWFLYWAERRRQALLTCFVPTRLLERLTIGRSARRNRLRRALLLGGVLAAFLALARPQWGFDWEEAHQRGLDILVAVDTSRSMLAEDARPNRLARAKLAALDLMTLAHKDRLGLIAFAGTAFLQCPLTLDDEAFRQSVDALDTSILPQGGTDIAAAIDTALRAFKDENNFKILVLFSDGEDQDGAAVDAAQRAARAGLRIFTVGVGTPAGEIIRVTDDQGSVSYVKDAQGNVVKSRLNEPLLQQVATDTGGFYLPLRSPDTMDTLYQRGLAPLPKSEFSARLVRHYHERFHWPLLIALACLIAESLLHDRRRRTAPRTGAAPSSGLAPASGAMPAPTAVPRITTALVLTLAALPALASPPTAARQYDRGDYAAALREYEALLERHPEDLRLQFNAGAAAYRLGRFDDAIQRFGRSANAPDLHLQQKAYFNRGDALFRSGEGMPDGPEKATVWRKSTNDFGSALRLDPQDADARANLAYATKQLEELLKRLPPSPSQNQKQQPPPSQDKDQNKSNDQPPPSSSPEQQQKKPDSNKPQSSPHQSPSRDERPDENKKQDQDKSSKSDQAQQDQPKPPDAAPSSSQQQPRPQPGTEPKPPSGQQPGKSGADQPQPAESGTNPQGEALMTPSQAERLLDSQKGDVRAMIFAPNTPRRDPEKPFNDW